MAVFETGSLVFLDYDERPPCIHTRLVLGFVEGLDYVVCTPDMDVFTETLDVSNPDLIAACQLYREVWYPQA